MNKDRDIKRQKCGAYFKGKDHLGYPLAEGKSTPMTDQLPLLLVETCFAVK